MSFTELTCPRCGGELQPRGDTYKCNCCGKTFEKEQTINVADELRAVLNEQKLEAVANLRQRLWKETHKKYIENKNVGELSSGILNYLPDDFYAGFYYATCSKQKNALSEFFEDKDLDEWAEDIPDLCDYLITGLLPEWSICLSGIIEWFKDRDDLKNYNIYRTKFEKQYDDVEEGVFTPSIHRDVFICYSSKDMGAVDKLVSELEAENISCFVAARNLRHGAGSVDNYLNAIHTAIANCKIVLFISSANSRNVKCEAIDELSYIETNRPDMPRVEYLLQQYRGYRIEQNVKDFFKGLEYCVSLDDTVKRVIKTLKQPKVDKQAELKRQLEEQQRRSEQATRELQQKLAEEQRKAEELRLKAAEEQRKAEELRLQAEQQRLAEAQRGQTPTAQENKDVKYCKKCKAENKLTAKFCAKCGSGEFFANYAEYEASLYKYCKKCGTKNDAESKFCEECRGTEFVPTYAEYQQYLKEEEERKQREAEEAKRRAEEERKRREAEEEKLWQELLLAEDARLEALRNLKAGDTLTFGSYPQTKVTDSGLTRQLNNLAGTLPTSSYSGRWTSYKYYISNSNSTDFMWYCDVNYNGEKYRGVYFDKYRPYYVDEPPKEDNTYQKKNGYIKGKVYWFKYESIKWRVLEVRGKEAFVACDKLIDSQDYNHTDNNNYANSSIRKWLNNEFYNTAFNEAEKAKILQSVVDNSLASTCEDSNEYVCENTNDKIFLLSRKEATTTLYFKDSKARQKKPTDYALCQGADSGGWWWPRSPLCNDSRYAYDVSGSGDLNYGSVGRTYSGVCSALKMVIE